jgi:hypothetical protein
MNKAVKLLVLQAYRMLGLALERWNDTDGAPQPEVTGVIDTDLVEQERDRDELRRRGVNI